MDAQQTLALVWWEMFRDSPIPVKTLLSVRHPNLRTALAEVAPGGYLGDVSPAKLGRWLIRHEGMTVESGDERLTLARVPSTSTAALWRLQPAREMLVA